MARVPQTALLIVPVLLSAWALAGGLLPVPVESLEKKYKQEQADIDLVINRFQLDAATGKITGEQAQDRIDRWMSDNRQRLEQQVLRAAELDRVAPLPLPVAVKTQGKEATAPVADDNPLARRYAALQDSQAQKMRELGSLAKSAENLQDRVDDWARSAAGAALLREKAEIEASLRQPLGTQPVVLEVGEEAGPDEVAALEFQENAVRRIMDIRSRNPGADPEKMQDLIDAEREAFNADFQETARLLKQGARKSLQSRVDSLQAETGNAPSPAKGPK